MSRPLLLVLLTVLVGLSSTTPAQAIEAHVFTLRIGDKVNATKVHEKSEGKPVTEAEEDICTAASGDDCEVGQAGAGAGEFSYPSGIAVNDATKDVYVSDTENHRIDKISSDGTFIAAWGWGVANGANEYQVCTSACQAGLAGSGEGEISEPYSVAVDNSPGPRSGDVYVADSVAQRVEVFSPTGVPLGELTGSIAPSPFICPRGVAVSSVTGTVYVADECGRYVVAFEYSPEGARYKYIPDSLLGSEVGAPVDLAVDSSGDVDIVNAEGGAVLRFTDAAGPASVVVASGVEEDAVNITGDLYVATGNPGPIGVYEQSGGALTAFGENELTEPGPKALAVNDETEEVLVAEQSGHDVDFFAPVPLPGASTGSAGDITETTATLNGAVEPGGLTTTYYFEYGTSESYGQDAPLAPISAGSGSGSVAATESIVNLQLGTVYFYRLVAANSSHTSYGTPHTFKTLSQSAEVTVAAASDVTQTTALLAGTINPEGSNANFTFVYYKCAYEIDFGTVTCPALTVPGSSGAAGAGITAVPVSATLSGLESNTVYSYDISVANGGGSVLGQPQFFKTAPVPPNARTLTAGEVSEARAVIYGTVDPHGADTSYHFEYGSSVAYGSESPAVEADAGSGDTYTDVSTELTDLQPHTTYHFRIVATNNKTVDPQTTYGEDETFTTTVSEPSPHAPSVATGMATSVTQGSATLTGTVDPLGFDTTYFFEYGTTTYYGTMVPLSGGDAGSQAGSVTVSELATGLQPGTTYHYRLVANSADGTSYGEDEILTTLVAPVVSSLTVELGPSLLPIQSAKPKPRALTQAQQLANVLKRCKKYKARRSRQGCERAAHKKYASKPKKTKSPTISHEKTGR